MATILFWGSEDSDVFAVGAAAVDTTAGCFSPLVACGLRVDAPVGGPLTDYWRSVGQFASGTVMLAVWHWTDAVSAPGPFGVNASFLMRLLDSNGIPRIVVSNTGADLELGPFIMQKVDAAGNYTTLASGPFTGIIPSTRQRLAIMWTPFSCAFYIGSALVARYIGDTTTDGVTALGGFDLGEPAHPAYSGTSGSSIWSAPIVADFDCRSIDLMKLVLTGAGGASAWNGAADGSTVSEIVLDDTDGIDSEIAGQVELFTAPGTLPTGSWAILGVGVAALASASPYATQLSTSTDTPSGDVLLFTSTAGVVVGQGIAGTNMAPGTTVVSVVPNVSVTLSANVTGDVPAGTAISFLPPQTIELAVALSGTDYFSPPVKPTPSLDRAAFVFPVSPATSQLFTAAELSSIQVGVKSLA